MEKYYLAKSYQNFLRLGEPYIKNNKKYIDIQMKSGLRKTVRVYTRNEYYKLYPEGTSSVSLLNLKRALGFEFGNIHIVINPNEEEMMNCAARYHRIFGWYFPADMKPDGYDTKELSWEDISVSDSELKSDEVVREAVEALFYTPGHSQHQGEVGASITRELLVTDIEIHQTQYGSNPIYIMEDDKGNLYQWSSHSKTLSLLIGEKYKLKGSIKALDTYHNNKITVLTRCKEEK